LALLGSGAALAGDARVPAGTFFGFRLLDLENQSVKWQSARFGEPAHLTYGFAAEPTTTPGARNCAKLLPPAVAYAPSHISEPAFRREVAAAFRMWEAVADIHFTQAADPKTADILIGAQGEPVGRAFTNVELKPSPDNAADAGRKVIARSLICLNPRQAWKVGFDGNLNVYDVRYTIAHEIGHAIGLDHPSAAGELMSYRYDERHTGLQAGDVRGAALLYGPRGPDTLRGTPRATLVTETGSLPDRAPSRDAKQGSAFGIGEKSDPQAPASR
jgi:hypothetical protein